VGVGAWLGLEAGPGPEAEAEAGHDAGRSPVLVLGVGAVRIISGVYKK